MLCSGQAGRHAPNAGLFEGSLAARGAAAASAACTRGSVQTRGRRQRAQQLGRPRPRAAPAPSGPPPHHSLPLRGCRHLAERLPRNLHQDLVHLGQVEGRANHCGEGWECKAAVPKLTRPLMQQAALQAAVLPSHVHPGLFTPPSSRPQPAAAAALTTSTFIASTAPAVRLAPPACCAPIPAFAPALPPMPHFAPPAPRSPPPAPRCPAPTRACRSSSPQSGPPLSSLRDGERRRPQKQG